MKKQIKRVIAVLLCIVTALGVCINASAMRDGHYSEGYYWGESGGWYEDIYRKTIYPFTFEICGGEKAVVIGCDKNAKGEVTVPAKVDGVPVTMIQKEEAYEFEPDGCPGVTKVTLPDSIEYIGVYAFFGFSGLKEINIPAGVEGISWSAFKGCSSLKKLTLPEGLKYIAEDAFLNCTSLDEINIPSSAVSVNGNAFINTALYNDRSNWEDFAFYHDGALLAVEGASGKFSVKEGTRLIGACIFRDCDYLYQITLPASLRYISVGSELPFIAGMSTFADLPSLERFKVSRANPYYTADRSGVLYSKDKTVLVAFPRGSITVGYKVPDGVKYIEDEIECENLLYLSLPGSLEYIESVSDNITDIYYAGTEKDFYQIDGILSKSIDGNWPEGHCNVFFGADSLKSKIFAGGVMSAYCRITFAIMSVLKSLDRIGL